MGDEEIWASLEGQDGSTVSMTLLRTGFTCMKSIGLDYIHIVNRIGFWKNIRSSHFDT